MRPRLLDRSLTVHRIGTAGGDFPVWSSEGARRHAGRWHEPGRSVIYASLAFSTALLEVLARSGEMPRDQFRVEAAIPPGTSYEEVGPETVARWADADQRTAQAFGSAWADERRSCLLIVPSVVTWIDRNVIINAEHEEASRIEPRREVRVRWDERLFA